MNKLWMIAIMLALLITGVNAFPITTANTVEVYEKGVFYVEITNDSQELKDLELNLYTPSEIKINAPSKIAPNTNMTAQITVYNEYESYRQITSKLEVTLGNEIETKEIDFKFYPRVGTRENPLTGFFGLGTFANESSEYTLGEWVAFWVLIVIAAILLIALVARVMHRI